MKKVQIIPIIAAIIIIMVLISLRFYENREQNQEALPVTITYMASQDWVMDAEIELGERFTQETGIRIDYQIIPDDQYSNLLMTKLNTGECTDLFGSQSGRFDIVSQLDVEENALDLTKEPWVARLDPLVAEEVSVNGRVYGQPIQDASAVWAVAYNKRIFRDLGLEVPTTYTQFKTVCQTILDNGVTPIYECVPDGWHHTLWLPETAAALAVREPETPEKLNRNEMTMVQSPTLQLIAAQIREMVSRGYWGEDYMTNRYADAARKIAEGSYAMFLAQQGFQQEVAAAIPGFDPADIGYFVIPLADNQVLNRNPVTPTRFIYSGSEHPEEAKQYLEFLARPENLQYLIDHVPKYNNLPISGGTPSYSEEVQSFYASYSEQGIALQSAVRYVNPQWTEIGKELLNLISGQIDGTELLDRLDQNRADQARVNQDPNWEEDRN